MRSRFARDQHRLVLHMTHVSIQQHRRVAAVTTASAEPSGLWIARWRRRRKQRAAIAGRYTAPAACVRWTRVPAHAVPAQAMQLYV